MHPNAQSGFGPMNHYNFRPDAKWFHVVVFNSDGSEFTGLVEFGLLIFQRVCSSTFRLSYQHQMSLEMLHGVMLLGRESDHL